MKKSFRIFSLISLSLAVVVFATCKIGLGEAVDTEKPSISLDYPMDTSVIRGEFVIKGTMYDETSLKEVVLSFEKKDNDGVFQSSGLAPVRIPVTDFDPKKYDKKNGQIWTTTLNLVKDDGSYTMDDGEYRIIATVEDNAKRTQSTYSVYTIDNTPPILVVTQPSTVGEASEWTFGNILNFTGQQYDKNLDKNNGGKFEFSFYDEAGKEVANSTGSSFLANWSITFSKDESPVKELLDEMGAAESAKYWYAVTVQDGAVEYKDYTEDDTADLNKEGNKAVWYYSYTQITDLVEVGERSPKINELYDIENGGAVTGSRAGQEFPRKINTENLKDIQIANVLPDGKEARKHYGVFSVTNNVQPTVTINDGEIIATGTKKNSAYTFIGSETPLRRAIQNQVSPIATLRIAVAPGKNETDIQTSSLKYTLQKWNGSAYVTVDGKNETSFSEDKIVNGTTKIISYEGPATKGQYLLAVDAVDNANNSVIQNVFEFIVNEGIPSVTIEPGKTTEAKCSPKETNPDVFTVTMTATDDGDYIEPSIVEIFYNAEGEEEGRVDLTARYADVNPKKTSVTEDGKTVTKWVWNYDLDIPAEGTKRTFKFNVNDGGYDGTGVVRSFWLDTEPPSLYSIIKPEIKEEGHVAEGFAVREQRAVTVSGYINGTDTEFAYIAYTKNSNAPNFDTLSSDGNNGWKTVTLDDQSVVLDGKSVLGFKTDILLPSDSVNSELPEEGIYYVWMYFIDDAGGRSAPTSFVRKILADTHEPQVLFAFEDDSIIVDSSSDTKNATGDFKVNISINETNGIHSIAKSLLLNGVELGDAAFEAKGTNSWSVTGNQDGTYVIKVDVTDVAGKTDSQKWTIKRDVGAPEIDVTYPLEDGVVVDKRFTITGFAKDAASGIGKLAISFDGENWLGTEDKLIGENPFIYEEDGTHITNEGTYKLYVWACDGTGIQYGGGVSVDRQPSVEKAFVRNFRYDTSAPEFRTDADVKINANSTFREFVNSELTFTGKVYDSYGLKSLKAVETYGGNESDVSSKFTLTKTDNSNWIWSFATGSLDSGTHEYNLTVTDLNDRASTITYFVNVDKTSPTVTIEKPAATAINKNALNASPYKFTGAALDNEDGVGVSKVYYAVTKASSAPEKNSENYAALNFDGNIAVSWATDMTLIPGNAAYQDNTISEGEWYLHVYAQDSSGNSSAVVSRKFDVDLTDPSVAESAFEDDSITDRTKNFSLRITASDTNAVSKVEVLQKIGSTGEVLVYSGNEAIETPLEIANLPRKYAGIAENTVSQEALSIAGGLADGIYEFTIRVTDASGKVSTEKRNVRLDTLAPSITMEVPSNGAAIWNESVTKLSGNANDKIDVRGVYYSFDYGDKIDASQEPVWIACSGNSTWEVTSNYMPEGFTEGTYNVWFYAEDEAGNNNIDTPKMFTINVDSKAPVLTMDTDIPGSSIVSDTFNLWGTLVEANLQSLVITAVTSSETYSWNLEPVQTDTDSYTWNVKYLLGPVFDHDTFTLPDGSYAFTITATDNAGKSHSLPVSATIDTTPPVIAVTPGYELQYDYNNEVIFTDLHPNQTVRGTASDANGIAQIQYAITSSTAQPVESAWKQIVGNTEWEKTFNLADPDGAYTAEEGTWYLHISAVDLSKARTSITPMRFIVDKAAPTIEITTAKNPVSNAYSYNDNFNFTGNVTDATNASAPLTVTVTQNAGSYTKTLVNTGNNLSFVYAVPVKTEVNSLAAMTADGSYTITVTVKDLYNRSVSKTFEFVRDVTAPELQVLNLSNNDIIASTSYTVRGSLSDATSAINKVEYRVQKENWSAYKTVSSSGAGWALEMTNVSEFNLTDGKTAKIQFRGTDVLGNETLSEIITYTCDLTDPTLSITTIAGIPYNSWVDGTGKNADFVVAGTVWDSSSITAVQVSENDGAYTDASASGLDGAVAEDAKANWTYTVSIPQDHSKDGIRSIKVRATDKAGKTSEQSFKVLFDTTLPEMTSIVLPTTTETEQATVTFKGTASDGAGSGISLVEISCNGGSTGLSTTGTGSWSASANVASFYTSGSGKHIWYKLTDTAGNTTGWIESAESFTVDTRKPNIAFANNIPSDVNGTFSLSGTADDDWGIASISVTQNGLAISPEITGTSSWTISGLPYGTSADGNYTYVVTARDNAGKTKSTEEWSVRKDTTAPDVNTITDPASDSSAIGTSAISSVSYIFRGLARDAAGGVGMDRIYYAFTTGPEAPATSGNYEYYSSLSVSDGQTWTITKAIDEGTDTDAAITSDKLCEGIWYMHVIAADKSGNASTAVTRKFEIDKSYPVISESVFANDTLTDSSSYTFAVTASDSRGVKSVVVKQGDLVIDEVNNTAVANRPVTLLPRNPDSPASQADISNGAADGVYSYSFIVTDMADKVTTIKRNIRFDTSAPEITMTSPANGDGVWINKISPAVTGIANDATSVSSVYISLDGSNWSEVTGKTNWSYAPTFLEGTQQVYFYARDGLGNNNQANPVAYTVNVDTSDPVLTLTTTGVTDEVATGDFTISGTITEANINSVRITSDAYEWDLTPAGTKPNYTYSVPFKANSVYDHATYKLPDGKYTFTVTVTDKAGKTVSKQQTVTLDTEKPSLAITQELSGNYIYETKTVIFKDINSSQTVKGSAADSGTGIDIVQYAVSTSASSEGLIWNNAIGTTSWTVSLDLSAYSETDWYLYLRTKDKAGLYSDVTYRQFIIDAGAPEVIINTAGGNRNADFNVEGSASGVVAANNVTASVTGPGGYSVNFANAGSIGAFSFAIPVSTSMTTDGTYTVRVAAIDKYERETARTMTFVRDRTAPNENTITSPESDLTGNNAISTSTYTFRGTAGDALSGIAKIQYVFTTSSEEPDSGWTDRNTTGSWSIVKNIDEGTQVNGTNLCEGIWYLFVKAFDATGNASASVRRQFAIDLGNPHIEETLIATHLQVQRQAAFAMRITASDSNNVTSVTVKQTKDSGNSVLIYTGSSAGTFDLSDLPRDLIATSSPATLTDGIADGIYEYLIEVTDAAGKTASLTRKVRLDTMPPVISVTSPANDTWITSLTPSVAGSVTDATSSVTKVYYSTDSGASWKDASYVPGSGSWSVTQGNLFTEGLQQILFAAEDAHGNSSKTNPVVHTVKIDQTNPVLTLDAIADIANNIFSLSGTLVESNIPASNALVLSTIYNGNTYRWDLTSELTDPVPAAANTKKWSSLFTPGAVFNEGTRTLPDGTYTFTITATDIAEKQDIKTKTIVVDTLMPELTAISPLPTVYQTEESSFTFRGSASDGSGSGIRKVELAFKVSGTGPYTVLPGDIITATGAETFAASVTYSDALPASGQPLATTRGQTYIYYCITDNAGNETGWTRYASSFNYDTATPLISYNGDAIRYESGSYSISGTASDDWEVASVTVTQKKDDGDAVTISTSGVSGTESWSLTDLPRNPSAVGSQLLADGTYTYVFTVTDSAGKTKSTSAIVVNVDTSAPDANVITSPAEGTTGVSAISANQFTFQGYANDAGVGMSKIYYAFSTDSTAPAHANAQDLEDNYQELNVSNNVTWNIVKSIVTGRDSESAFDQGKLCEGSWYMYVIAEDKSGNRTSPASVYFEIDNSAPLLNVTDSPAALVKKGTALTIAGTVSDTNAMTSLRLKLNGDFIDSVYEKIDFTTNVWGYTFANGEDGNFKISQNTSETYEITVVATDIVGRTTEQVYTVYYDVHGPEVEEPSISPTVIIDTTEKVNGIITVRGRITEEKAIASVALKYYDSSDNEYTGEGLPSGIAKPGNSDINWSYNFNVDTTKLKDNDVNRIRIIATDTAGNQTTRDVELNVDQSTDLPIVTFTGITECEYSAIDADNNADNLFGLGNNSVRFTVTDDDGIADVKINVVAEGGEVVWTNDVNSDEYIRHSTSVYPVSVNSGYSLTNAAKYPDGNYEVRIYALDSKGNENDYYTSTKRNIIIDRAAPTLVINQLTGQLKAASSDVVITGTFGDAGPSANITAAIPLGFTGAFTRDATYAITSGQGDKNQKWQYVVTKPNGGFTAGTTIVFTATDAYKRITEMEWSFKVDTKDPLISVDASNTNLGGTSPNYFLNVSDSSPYLIVNGLAKDDDEGAEGASGIDHVEYSILLSGTIGNNEVWGEVQTAQITGDSAQNPDGEGNWKTFKANVDFYTGVSDGAEKSIKFWAVDAAGASSLHRNDAYKDAVLTFRLDNRDPLIKATSFMDNTIDIRSDESEGTSSVLNQDASSGIFTFAGTAYDSLGISSIKYTVTKDGVTSAVHIPTSVVIASQNATWSLTDNWNDADTMTKYGFSGDATGSYEYVFTVTDNSNRTGKITIRTTIDLTPPTVLKPAISTLISANGKDNNVNGIIRLSGSITDNKTVQSAVYEILASDNGTSGWTSVGSGNIYNGPVSTTYNTAIDTTSFANNKYWKITVEATDNSGNVSSVTADTTTDVVYVDQDTDKPTLALSNAVDTIVTSGGVKVNSNLFETSGNNKLLATITDDDSIAYVLVETWTSEQNPASDDAAYTIRYPEAGSIGKTTYSLTHTLPASEGLYQVKITSSDTSATPVETVTGPFWIGLDNASPMFTITTPGGGYYSQNFTISGSVQDSSGTVVIDVDDANTNVTTTSIKTTPVTKNGTASETQWQDEITVPNETGAYSIKYTATDSYDRTTTAEFRFNVDKSAPVFSIGNETPLENSYIKLEDRISFAGSVTENASGDSGVEGIYYIKQSASVAEPLSVNKETWTRITSTSWATEVNFDAEGDYKVYFAALDNAGNTSAIQNRTIHVDGANPAASIALPGSAGSGKDKTVNTTYYRGGAFTLSGTASDTYLASARLTVSLNGQTPQDITSGWTLNAGNWTYDQAAVDGTYDYTLTVTDYAGRTSTATQKVIIDTSAPVLNIIAPVASAWQSTASVTVLGTVSDVVGVSNIYYRKGDTGDWLQITNATNWSQIVAPGDGQWTYYFYAVDEFGNASTPAAHAIYIDTANPSVTDNSTVAAITNTGFTLTGTASDANLEALTITSGITQYTNDGTNTAWSKTFVVGSANSSAANYLADGSYTFVITATDKAGKTVSKQRTVLVDTVSPVVADPKYAYTEGSVIYTDIDKSYAISGTVSDANPTSSIASVWYAVTSENSQPVISESSPWSLLNGTATWAGTISLDGVADGTYYIWIYAKDTAGNVSAVKTHSYKTDGAAPSVTITTASSGQLILGSAKAVAGTTSGAESVSAVAARTDGAGAPVALTNSGTTSAFNFNVDVPSLANDGSYTVTVTASDENGRSSSAAYLFTRDTTSPVVTLTNIANGGNTIIMDSAPKVYGSVTDAIGLKENGVTYYYEKSTDGGNTFEQAGETRTVSVAGGSLSASLVLNMVTDLGASLTDGYWRLVFTSDDNRSDGSNAQVTTSAKFLVDRAAPSLSVTSPLENTSYAKKGASVNVTGLADDAGGIETVVIKLGDTTISTIEAASIAQNGAWSSVINASSFNQSASASYTLNVIATDVAGRSTEVSRTIFYDVELPVMTITAISPIVGDKVNGEIRIQGTTSDNDMVSSATYTYGGLTSAVGANYTNWSFTLDTTDSSDGNLLSQVLSFAASDRAGNAADVSSIVSTLAQYTIDQDSDKPVITLDNMTAIAGTSPVRYLLMSTESIGAMVTDDDGLSNVTCTITSGTGSLNAPTKPAVNSTSGRFSQSLTSLAEGEYTLTITATDNVKGEATSVLVPIAIDNSNPEVSFNLTSNRNTYRSNFDIIVTSQDTATVKSIEAGTFADHNGNVTDGRVASTIITTTGRDTTEMAVTFRITTSNTAESPVTLSFVATDKYGKPTIKEFQYAIDLDAPVVTCTDDGAHYVDSEAPSRRITGTASDAISGLDQVRYLVLPASDTAPTASTFTSTTGLQATGTTAWVANIDMTSYVATQDTYKVYVAAFDNAGNCMLASEVPTLTIDNAPPLAGNISVIPANALALFDADFAITGTASDTLGLKSVTAAIRNGAELALSAGTPVFTSGTNYNWKFDVPMSAFTADGVYEVVVTATDLCNKTAVSTYSFTVDTTAPEIAFNNIAAQISAVQPVTNFITNSISIISLATDTTSGVQAYTYQFQRYANSEWVNAAGNGAAGSGTYAQISSSQTITLAMDSFLGTGTDGIYRLQMTLTDKAGNTSDTLTSPCFRVDQTKPSLAITSPALSAIVQNGDSITVAGSASDSLELDHITIQINHQQFSAQEKELFSKTIPLASMVQDGGAYKYTWTPETSPFNYNDDYTITVMAYDIAGNSTEISRDVSCDNTPPRMVFSRPFSMDIDTNGSVIQNSTQIERVIGDITVTGNIPSGTGYEFSMGSIYYQIGTRKSEALTITYDMAGKITGISNSGDDSKVGFVSGDGVLTDPVKDGEGNAIIGGKWKKSSDAYNWDFTFNSLNYYRSLAFQDTGDVEANEVTLNVFIVAVDTAGNINLATLPIRLDTDIDKPTVEIASPETAADTYSTAGNPVGAGIPAAAEGGAFMVTGSASDNNFVHSVYMQVELVGGNYVNNVLTSSGDSAWTGASVTGGLTYANTKNGGTVSKYFTKIGEDDDAWYKVNGTTTWKWTMNQNGEWDLSKLSDYLTSAFKTATQAAYEDSIRGDPAQWSSYSAKSAQDKLADALSNTPAELAIKVKVLDTKVQGRLSTDGDGDGMASRFGTVITLPVYVDAGAPGIILTRFPDQNSYQNGSVPINFTLTDDSALSTFSFTVEGKAENLIDQNAVSGVQNAEGLTLTKTSSTSWTVSGDWDAATYCRVNGVSRIKFSISVSDGTKTSSSDRTFFVDVLPPSAVEMDGDYILTVEMDKASGTRSDVHDQKTLLPLKSESAVIKGKVIDDNDGSGVDKVILMLTKYGDDSVVYNLSSGEISDYPMFTFTDGNGNNHPAPFTSAQDYDAAENPGGVVLKAIPATPYAVIDNLENGEDNHSINTNADEDGYRENIKSNGEWFITLDTTVLEDNVYTLNYIIVDKSGNATWLKDYVITKNHAPVITSIVLGTDLNGDNDVTINALGVAGEDLLYTSESLTDTQDFTVRNNKFVILVNVTGGTGNKRAYLTYRIGNTEYNPTALVGDNAIDSDCALFVLDNLPADTDSFSYTVLVRDSMTVSLSSDELTFAVKIDNTDDTAPVGQFIELNTLREASATGNERRGSLYYTTKDSFEYYTGHVEIRDNAPVNAGNPALSGHIILRGQAYDDQKISSIVLTIVGDSTQNITVASDNASHNLTVQSGAALVENELTQEGHFVEWSYDWDTSTIQNVAKENVSITLNVTDKSGNIRETPVSYSSAENTPRTETNKHVYADWGYDKMNVDVVPYIISVARNSRYNTIRARSGAYSLLRGEADNTITGFNLKGATDIKIGNASMATKNTTDETLTFTVLASSKDGPMTVTVNGVDSINNKNAYVNSNLVPTTKVFDRTELTDDVYIHVWRVSQQDTFKGSKNANYPAMSSDSSGNLYASFTNYGQAKSYYSKAFIGNDTVGYETSANATGDVTTVFYGYDPSEDTDISVGADGKVNVFYNANFHGGQNTHWSGTTASNAGGIFVYDPDATSITYNTNSSQPHRLFRFELYTYDNELNQFKNTRVKRTYLDDVAYTNIAYYDRLANAIKYSFASTIREHTVFNNTDVTFTSGTTYFTSSTNTNFNNYYVEINGAYYQIRRYNNNNQRYTITGYNGGTFTSKIYNAESQLYDTTTNGLPWVTIDGEGDGLDTSGTTEDTNETFTFAGGWRPFKLTAARYSGVTQTTATGESVALTATPNGYPVVMYMDAATSQPRIAFANSRTPNNAANWSVQGVFASTDANYNTASDYMSCMVDNDGYLHIAFQNTKGELVYGKSTNNPSDGTTAYTFGASQVLDDSGMWIDMTMNGTTPYISYLSKVNSYDGMKIAYYDADFDEDNDGVAEGGWETMTAPLDAKVTNVRSCIEVNAKAFDGNTYKAAVGFCPGSDYRAAFYVGE